MAKWSFTTFDLDLLEILAQAKLKREEKTNDAQYDTVNHPAHYTFGKFEVIDVLEEWFPTNPLLWQVGKYIARADHKGKPLEDLKKARWYLQREIDRLERIEAHGV